jgi:hypothetical protein
MREDNGCPLCRRRYYICSDGATSDGLLFHAEPDEAYSRIIKHEREHIRIAREQARREGKEVVDSKIKVEFGRCRACGRLYPAGGRAIIKVRQLLPLKPPSPIPSLGRRIDFLA